MRCRVEERLRRQADGPLAAGSRAPPDGLVALDESVHVKFEVTARRFWTDVRLYQTLGNFCEGGWKAEFFGTLSFPGWDVIFHGEHVAKHGAESFFTRIALNGMSYVPGGAATCSEGFVVNFLKVPLACWGSSVAAVQPNNLRSLL